MATANAAEAILCLWSCTHLAACLGSAAALLMTMLCLNLTHQL